MSHHNSKKSPCPPPKFQRQRLNQGSRCLLQNGGIFPVYPPHWPLSLLPAAAATGSLLPTLLSFSLVRPPALFCFVLLMSCRLPVLTPWAGFDPLGRYPPQLFGGSHSAPARVKSGPLGPTSPGGGPPGPRAPLDTSSEPPAAPFGCKSQWIRHLDYTTPLLAFAMALLVSAAPLGWISFSSLS
jgi:hypothetical protein